MCAPKRKPPILKVGGLLLRSGGPKGARTLDLHNAIVALSQLSYGPIYKNIMPHIAPICKMSCDRRLSGCRDGRGLRVQLGEHLRWDGLGERLIGGNKGIGDSILIAVQLHAAPDERHRVALAHSI